MADVVLVYPRTLSMDVPGVSLEPPYGLMELVPPLHRAGFSVAIVDQRVDPHWERTLEALVATGALCVGISSMVGPQIRYGLDASRLVRRLDPRIPIVWGGPHPSSMPEATSRDPLVDAVVVGEGEGPFTALVEGLASGRAIRDLAGIPGLYVDGVGTREDPPSARLAPLSDEVLDRVDMERYLVGLFEGTGRGLHLITSRGCPHACSFCFIPRFHQRRWRAMSAEDVLGSIEHLCARYRLDGIAFNDDNFFSDLARVRDIVTGILERGLHIKWKALVRAQDVLRMEPDLLDRMRESGLAYLFVGADSGSDRVLALFNKGITRDGILLANRRLAEHGIAARYNFIIGAPTETPTETAETLDLADRLLAENPRAGIAGVLPYVPLIGNPLFERAVELGYRPPATLEAWSRATLEEAERPFLSPAHARAVKRFFYLSAMVGTVSGPNTFRDRPLLRLAMALYGPVARLRWRRRFLGLPIDLLVMEQVHRGGWLARKPPEPLRSGP